MLHSSDCAVNAFSTIMFSLNNYRLVKKLILVEKYNSLEKVVI